MIKPTPFPLQFLVLQWAGGPVLANEAREEVCEGLCHKVPLSLESQRKKRPDLSGLGDMCEHLELLWLLAFSLG